jgi:hypothetical protein
MARSFYDFPWEIRMMIWKHVLPFSWEFIEVVPYGTPYLLKPLDIADQTHPRTILVRNAEIDNSQDQYRPRQTPTATISTSLFRVSKLISRETRKIFYANTIFYFPSPDRLRRFLVEVPQPTVSLFRHVAVSLNDLIGPTCKFQHLIVLPNVKLT